MVSRLFRLALPLVSITALVAACAGPEGPPGSSCHVLADDGGTGATIVCNDGTRVHITNGMNGANGMSCTISPPDDAGGRTITCPDGTVVTVHNGRDADCTATTNPDSGVVTLTCNDGTSTTILPGNDFRIPMFHGQSYLTSSGEYANGAKRLVDATITSATADPAGVVTVNFTVHDPTLGPVTTLTSIRANIDKLVPASDGDATNHWVPYLWQTETVSATGTYPMPAGTRAFQGGYENNGTLTNHHDGTYTYVFATNLTHAMMGTTPVTYDRSLTHRVVIMMGGHSGPTADAHYDFVPDGSAMTETRDVVQTSACQNCHGPLFHAHGGDRLHVETCQNCHVPGATDAQSGNSLDLKVMIHRIHAGSELPSVRGPDGIFRDDPSTPVDESADNGSFAIWGYNNTRNSWEDVEFPAVLQNCTKCHQGSGANMMNYIQHPGRAACGSCHDSMDFVAGTNHPGGPQADDSHCSTCHMPTLGLAPIGPAHDWVHAHGDTRNDAEFNATLTVSSPANGIYFTRGEAPVVTLVLHDAVTGALLDHTTIVEASSAQGCASPGTSCPPRDGHFSAANFFVEGPRGHRMPVLTTAARSQVFSSNAGPFDLSAAGASLTVVFDSGVSIHSHNQVGDDTLLAGTVTVPVAASAFANVAAATPTEIAAWLNANPAFAARGIAFLNGGGRVGIRSRNLGHVFALQLQAGPVTTAVFGGDVTVHMPTGMTPSNNISQRINPANNDPKVTWTADSIQYQLDPVDDLQPGTYIVSIEFADRGRVDDTNYVTPTVARTTFQVGTPTEELPPAGNCASCHEAPDGRGFVLDYPRHHKIFNNTAVDQCGSCHDYQPQNVNGTSFPGAIPIARRVHAVHAAASFLNYPALTVGHADTVPGRNWDLPFPQDIRSCQSCHPDGTTSGSWATRPARIPCMGCHDSDAATSHMTIQTFDPTPASPWSGDEQESCSTCH